MEQRLRPSAQSALGLPLGTIKATVLIETLPAAFEMDEILYELRDHMAGLNCGRWDYIFSFIKTLATNKEFVLAGPLAGGDVKGVPGRLFGPADQDLPQARLPSRWAAWRRRFPTARIRSSQCAPSPR